MESPQKDFIAEAEELVEEAGRLLVEIQGTYATGTNPDTINALFRALHTMKGISSLFGFKGISEYSHALESLLDEIRLGKLDITGDVVQFLFSNIDVLNKVIKDIAGDKEPDVSVYLKDIESFRKSAKEGGPAQKSQDPLSRIDESITKVLSEYEEHRLRANIKDGKGIYMARAVFSFTDFDKRLSRLTELIKANGELISTLPTSTDVPPDSIGFNLIFGSSKAKEELKQALDADIEEMLKQKADTAAPPAQKPQEVSLKSSSTHVRVDIEKLDSILNTINELILTKTAIDRIASEMSESFGHTRLVVDILKISQVFGRRIAELQEQVLEIRMISIGQIFSRLSQITKRYSNETGKYVDLVTYGEDTELDKHLAEEIADPLMHIVRNAIDHGIESPEERKAAGKSEGGTIILKAFQRGNHVVIEVKDDGSGINIERVKKKALEKGLIAPGSELDRREILDFIFMPGFSTKAAVSEVSGRGVGMDVVKESLLSLGGFVEVETEDGKGTTFRLTMPITLAIIKALIIKVGSERFAVPLTSLSETLVIMDSDLQAIEGKSIYNLRGEMLPIVSIAGVFDLKSEASGRSFAVVVGYGDRRLGLLVDEMIGQHEIVIKSLGDYFKGLRGFAGAAEIGRHEVILVIDTESLIEEFISKQRAMSHV